MMSEHEEAAETQTPPASEQRGGLHSIGREVIIVVGTALVLAS